MGFKMKLLLLLLLVSCSGKDGIDKESDYIEQCIALEASKTSNIGMCMKSFLIDIKQQD